MGERSTCKENETLTVLISKKTLKPTNTGLRSPDWNVWALQFQSKFSTTKLYDRATKSCSNASFIYTRERMKVMFVSSITVKYPFSLKTSFAELDIFSWFQYWTVELFFVLIAAQKSIICLTFWTTSTGCWERTSDTTLCPGGFTSKMFLSCSNPSPFTLI